MSPASHPEGGATNPKIGTMGSAGAPKVQLSGRRILAVEDELLIGLALEDILVGAGCVVLNATTLAGATNMAETVQLDAALLDINLGRQYVFPAAYALRDRGIPFAFLTAYDRSVIPVDLAGASLLQKPYLHDHQVLRLLRDLLSR